MDDLLLLVFIALKGWRMGVTDASTQFVDDAFKGAVDSLDWDLRTVLKEL